MYIGHLVVCYLIIRLVGYLINLKINRGACKLSDIPEYKKNKEKRNAPFNPFAFG